MVMKKQAVKAAPKNDDSVVYKVMVALLIACLECLALQQVAKVYAKAVLHRKSSCCRFLHYT